MWKLKYNTNINTRRHAGIFIKISIKCTNF